MNNCNFIGRISKEPSLTYTKNGVAVVNLSIAVQDKFKNQSGDYGVTFVNLVAWKGLAETIANHCKVGDQIGVTGRYQVRDYENSEGRKVYISEFVVNEFTFGQKKQQEQNNNTQSNNDPFDGAEISDSDLPF